MGGRIGIANRIAVRYTLMHTHENATRRMPRATVRGMGSSGVGRWTDPTIVSVSGSPVLLC
jgi:hypothetical protein